MEKTLLDEFAMAALTGMFSDPSRMATSDNYASEAYKYAQAMMEERKKHIEVEDDGWIDWNGEECPVDENVMVEIITETRTKFVDNAFAFLWGHSDDYERIIKYRVLK